MMKVLRQFLLLTAILIGFSLTATAQKQQDEKKTPPKEDPPKIKIEPKKPDKPKDDKKDNKDNKDRPELVYLKVFKETEIV